MMTTVLLYVERFSGLYGFFSGTLAVSSGKNGIFCDITLCHNQVFSLVDL